MFYFVTAVGSELHADDVEADLPLVVHLRHVGCSRLLDQGLLALVDKAGGFTEPRGAARFYFYENEYAAQECNKVKFRFSVTPVAIQNSIPLFLKVISGDGLTAFAGVEMTGLHRSILGFTGVKTLPFEHSTEEVADPGESSPGQQDFGDPAPVSAAAV